MAFAEEWTQYTDGVLSAFPPLGVSLRPAELQPPEKTKLKIGGKIPVSELVEEAFSVVGLILRNSLKAGSAPNWFEAELLGMATNC